MKNNNPLLICDPTDSIVILLDFQTHLISQMPAKVLARLQRNTGLLIKAAKELSIPIFATEQDPRNFGNMEPIIAESLPSNAKTYEKTSFSCTDIDEFMIDISQTNRKQIIIAGMEAHISVLQSAIQFQSQDYQVGIVADAVCSKHRENYEIALQRLRANGITIADAESVVFEWLRDAKNEYFKTIHSLVS